MHHRPLWQPQSLAENVQLPQRKLENRGTRNLGTLATSSVRIPGILQRGLLIVQISEVARRVSDFQSRALSISLFFWACSFVVLCSFSSLSMGRSKRSASGSFDFSRPGWVLYSDRVSWGNSGEPTPVQFLRRVPED